MLAEDVVLLVQMAGWKDPQQERKREERKRAGEEMKAEPCPARPFACAHSPAILPRVTLPCRSSPPQPTPMAS